MASNTTFDSTDELLNEVADQLQWVDIANESLTHNLPVMFVPRNISGQPEQEHIGTVTKIQEVNGKHVIHLTDCSIEGRDIRQKLKFNFDQLRSFSLARMQTQNYSFPNSSFSLISETSESDTSSFLNQTANMTDQSIRNSTPTSELVERQSDLDISFIQTIIPITTTQTRKLPILADGKTLDKEYLELIWKNEEENLDFTQWCDKMQITSQMTNRNLQFGQSLQKTKLFAQDSDNATKIYTAWMENFKNHYLTFDEWYKPDIPPTSSTIKFSNVPAYDLKQLFIDAQKLIAEIPKQDYEEYKHLYYAWFSTLIRKHQLSFSDWLKNPMPDGEYNQLNEQLRKQKTQPLITAEIQPFIHLCSANDDELVNDYNNLHEFVIDQNTLQLLRKPYTVPLQEHFHPFGPLSYMFVPAYIHSPYNAMNFLRMTEVSSFGHVRHLVWSRLKTVQHSAYINNQTEYEKFANTDKYDHISPFVRIYRQQTGFELQPDISPLQITQHVMAHERLKDLGGLDKVSSHEFYDLFFRPFEFLITRGMPMHKQLLAATYSYNERFNLFRNFIELAGFSIYENIPNDVHQTFSELSRSRHFDPYELTETRNHIFNPLHRIDAMPSGLDRQPTRAPTATITTQDFKPQGRLFGYKPSKFIPLDNQILDKFPELGARKINMIDHHTLHQEALKMYERFQRQGRPLPKSSFRPISDRRTEQIPEATRRPANRAPKPTPRAPQPQPEKVSPEPRKNPQAPTGQEVRTLIQTDIDQMKESEQNKIEEQKLQLQQLQYQQYQQQEAQLQQLREPPRDIQQPRIAAIPFGDKHIKIQLWPQQQQQQQPIPQPQPQLQQPYNYYADAIAPENFYPPNPVINLPKEEMWRYDQEPQERLNQVTSPQQPQETSTPNAYPEPLRGFQLTPQHRRQLDESDKFDLRRDPQMLPAHIRPNMEFIKPLWMMEPTRGAPNYQIILIGDFLWSGQPFEKVPEPCKYAHSAASISRHMDRQITAAQTARYKTMPCYRQIPLDGIFSAFNAITKYVGDSSGDQIDISISEIQHQPKPYVKEVQRTLNQLVPTHVFHRMTNFMQDMSEVPLPPRVEDPQSTVEVLQFQTLQMSEFIFTIQTKICRRGQRSERFTYYSMRSETNPDKYPDREYYVPWFQSAELVKAMNDLYREMYLNKYL